MLYNFGVTFVLYIIYCIVKRSIIFIHSYEKFRATTDACQSNQIGGHLEEWRQKNQFFYLNREYEEWPAYIAVYDTCSSCDCCLDVNSADNML